MPFWETVIDAFLQLNVGGVTIDQLATVGVILAVGYGAVMFGKNLIDKHTAKK